MGMPEVLVVIKVPSFLKRSTFSKTNFLISRFSTTTSIIQSTSPSQFILSSKLPVVTREDTFLLKTGDGFAFKILEKFSFTILLRTAGLSSVSPFCFSFSFSSFGGISNKYTLHPMFAKCKAILEPITPEPKTATLFIFLFIIFSLIIN